MATARSSTSSRRLRRHLLAPTRLRTLSDALTDMLDSPSGLMVHGAPAGFDVRALQGKAPKGFAYLDEGLGMAVDQCYADMP